MFVHINPEINSFGETLSTLKFAERVASIELGAARANKETGELKDLKEEVSFFRSVLFQLFRQKKKIDSTKSMCDASIFADL